MASSSQATAIGTGEERNEEAAPACEGGNGGSQQLVLPEDGYEWRKYGQKFIKSIQKYRSYFRCRDKVVCGAKKKVEWHPRDPNGNLRIVYVGTHQHGAPAAAAAASPGGQQQGGGGASDSNRYELGAQYFGGARSQ